MESALAIQMVVFVLMALLVKLAFALITVDLLALAIVTTVFVAVLIIMMHVQLTKVAVVHFA